MKLQFITGKRWEIWRVKFPSKKGFMLNYFTEKYYKNSNSQSDWLMAAYQ